MSQGWAVPGEDVPAPGDTLGTGMVAGVGILGLRADVGSVEQSNGLCHRDRGALLGFAALAPSLLTAAGEGGFCLTGVGNVVQTGPATLP